MLLSILMVEAPETIKAPAFDVAVLLVNWLAVIVPVEPVSKLIPPPLTPVLDVIRLLSIVTDDVSLNAIAPLPEADVFPVIVAPSNVLAALLFK